MSETNSGNILLVRDETVVRPVSPHVLPGVMEKIICELLKDMGFKVIEEIVMPNNLYNAHLVLICNSLMGAVPAAKIDGIDLNSPSDLWMAINEIVL